MGDRVLVTGGAGFLGSAVCRRLLARGCRVRAFQRGDSPALRALGVEVVRGSLGDAGAVAAAALGCDAIIHVAAKAGVWGSREDFVEANVVGTRHVLAAARRHGIGRLVHTSTPSVVFDGRSIAGADESKPLGTRFPAAYPETKAIAEREVLAAHDPRGLRTCALRPHLIWGPGDPHLLPRVVARARAGRLRRVGPGGNRVDMTHVEHAAEAHVLALEALASGRAGGKAYFLSDGSPIDLWPWIDGLLARLGLPPVPGAVPTPVAWTVGALLEGAWSLLRLDGEPPMTRFVAVELSHDHWFDISAARRDLGYSPFLDPRAAYEETVAWLAAGTDPVSLR